jgi:hypothetical protein
MRDDSEISFLTEMQRELNAARADRICDLERLFPFGVPSLPEPSRLQKFKGRVFWRQRSVRERLARWVAPWLDE